MREFSFNKITNPQILEDEIRESTIKVALDTVIARGDGVTIVYMKNDLDVADTNTLTEVVNNHVYVESIDDPQLVKVLEDAEDATQGLYQSIVWKWDIAACAPGTEQDLEAKSFPFPISALSLEWYNTAEINGDHMALLIAPDTITGVLTQDAVSGDDVIYASDTVMANAKRGFKYEVVNGATSFKAGRILEIDKGSSSLKLENPLNADFPAGSVLKQTIELSPIIHLLDRYIPEIGTNKIGGTTIPANVPMVVRYTNMDGQAKSLHIMLEYLY